jgi:hypothetical protein
MRGLPELIALQIAWSLKHHAPDEPRPEWAMRFIRDGCVPAVTLLSQYAAPEQNAPQSSCERPDPDVLTGRSTSPQSTPALPAPNRRLYTTVAWTLLKLLTACARVLGA